MSPLTPEGTAYRRMALGLRHFFFLKAHYEEWKRRNAQYTLRDGSRRIDVMPKQTPLPIWLYEAGWRS